MGSLITDQIFGNTSFQQPPQLVSLLPTVHRLNMPVSFLLYARTGYLCLFLKGRKLHIGQLSGRYDSPHGSGQWWAAQCIQGTQESPVQDPVLSFKLGCTCDQRVRGRQDLHVGPDRGRQLFQGVPKFDCWHQ